MGGQTSHEPEYEVEACGVAVRGRRARAARLSLLVPALCAASGLAFDGCGSADSPRLSSADAAILRADLSAAQTAAAGGDQRRTLDDLRRFAAEARRLRVAGRLTGAEADALAIGTARARSAALRELSLAATDSSPTRASSPPLRDRPNALKDKGHHRGHGKKAHGPGGEGH
jgi:hypothetical protein